MRFYISKFKIKPKTRFFFTFLVLIGLLYLLLCPVLKAGFCPCCPTVSGSNYGLLTPLINRLTNGFLIEHDLKLQLKKIALSYVHGSFFNKLAKSILTQKLNELANQFNVEVTQQFSLALKDGQLVIGNNLSVSNFSDTLISNADKVLQKSIYEILSKKTGKDISRLKENEELKKEIEAVSLAYNEKMASTSSFYEKYLNNLSESLNDSLIDNTSMGTDFIILGGNLDAVSNVLKETQGAGFTANSATETSYSFWLNRRKFADLLWGNKVREEVEEDVTSKNKEVLNNILLKEVFNVCRYYEYGYCTYKCRVKLSKQEINTIVDETNKVLISTANNQMQNTYSFLDKKLKEAYFSNLALAQKYSSKKTEILNNVFVLSKGYEVGVQKDYRKKLDNVGKYRNLTEKEWKEVVAKGVPKSEKGIVTFLAQDIWNSKLSKQQAIIDNIRRYLVAREAVKLAEEMEKTLKHFNLTEIDKETSDQAWKDALHFYYCWLVLENETLKLMSASSLARTAVFSE